MVNRSAPLTLNPWLGDRRQSKTRCDIWRPRMSEESKSRKALGRQSEDVLTIKSLYAVPLVWFIISKDSLKMFVVVFVFIVCQTWSKQRVKRKWTGLTWKLIGGIRRAQFGEHTMSDYPQSHHLGQMVGIREDWESVTRFEVLAFPLRILRVPQINLKYSWKREQRDEGDKVEVPVWRVGSLLSWTDCTDDAMVAHLFLEN